MWRRGLLGSVVAAALALSASDATLFGIEAWKILLAAAGAVVFVLSSDRNTTRR